jgi:HK97 family phage prohead protease
MPDNQTKTYAARIEINAEERSVIGYISTDSVDREGEVVIPKGLMLDSFRKSPGVLWCHDYKLPPVGKCLWIKTDDNTVWAKTQFADTPRGNEALYLYKEGFMTGFSIGFIADRTAYGPPSQKEMEVRPDWRFAKALIRKAEVIEYSVAIIACNRDAITRAYQTKSLNLSELLVHELELDKKPVEEKPVEKPAFSGIERITGTQACKAVRRAIKAMDPEEIAKGMDINKIVQDRLHVARGGV